MSNWIKGSNGVYFDAEKILATSVTANTFECDGYDVEISFPFCPNFVVGNFINREDAETWLKEFIPREYNVKILSHGQRNYINLHDFKDATYSTITKCVTIKYFNDGHQIVGNFIFDKYGEEYARRLNWNKNLSDKSESGRVMATSIVKSSDEIVCQVFFRNGLDNVVKGFSTHDEAIAYQKDIWSSDNNFFLAFNGNIVDYQDIFALYVDRFDDKFVVFALLPTGYRFDLAAFHSRDKADFYLQVVVNILKRR